jgi:hypothetical protein
VQLFAWNVAAVLAEWVLLAIALEYRRAVRVPASKADAGRGATVAAAMHKGSSKGMEASRRRA